MNRAARRRPRVDQLVAVGSDRGEGVGPGVDGRRQHDGGVAGDLGQGGAIAARPPACRAPSPRAPGRRSLRTPTGTRAPRRATISPSRSAAGTRPGRTTRSPTPSVGDRRRDGVVGGTGATEQDEHEVGVGPRSGEQLDEQPVTLVRMGDRRVHEDPAVTEPVAPAQLAGVGGATSARRVVAVRHDDDLRRIGAERVDQRVARRSGWHGDRRRPPRPIAARGGRRYVRRAAEKYCGYGEVLDVVDREQRRVAADGAAGGCRRRGGRRRRRRTCADRSTPRRACGPPRYRVDRSAGDQLEAVGELGVGRRRIRAARGGGPAISGATAGQPDELADEVLLGSADLARPAPQQVDPDTHRPPWFQKLGKNRVAASGEDSCRRLTRTSPDAD